VWSEHAETIKKHHNRGRIDRTGRPGGQNRAIYTTFGYVVAVNARTSKRPGGTLILAAKTTQQVEIEQVR
jgi:hypothetical protein